MAAGETQLSAVYEQAEYHLDLCIVLDVSASMEPLMDAARDQIKTLLDTIQAYARSDLAIALSAPRVAIITYSDVVHSASEQHAQVLTDFTTDTDEVYQRLRGVRCRGNTDFPEDPVSGLRLVDGLSWASGSRRSRVVMLFTDAPQHGKLWAPELTAATQHLSIPDNYPDLNASEDEVSAVLYKLAKLKACVSFVCMRSDVLQGQYFSQTMAQKWKALLDSMVMSRGAFVFKCGDMTAEAFKDLCVRAVTVSMTHPTLGTASVTRMKTISISVSEGRSSASAAESSMKAAIKCSTQAQQLASIAEEAAEEAALQAHDPSLTEEQRKQAAQRRDVNKLRSSICSTALSTSSRVLSRAGQAAEKDDASGLAPVASVMQSQQSKLKAMQAEMEAEGQQV